MKDNKISGRKSGFERVIRNKMSWPQQGEWLLLYRHLYMSTVFIMDRRVELQRLALLGYEALHGLIGQEGPTGTDKKIQDLKKQIMQDKDVKISSHEKIRRADFSWPLQGTWVLLYEYLYGKTSPIPKGGKNRELQRLVLMGFKYEKTVAKKRCYAFQPYDNEEYLDQEKQERVPDEAVFQADGQAG